MSDGYRRLPDALGNQGVQRDDGAIIPADPDNIDWQAYQAWLKAGNTPADAPSPAQDGLSEPSGRGP